MNMMAHTLTNKIAQREELSAAYARIDEVETMLRVVRDVLAAEGFQDDPDDIVIAIDDVLDPNKVVLDHGEAYRAVFENGV